MNTWAKALFSCQTFPWNKDFITYSILIFSVIIDQNNNLKKHCIREALTFVIPQDAEYTTPAATVDAINKLNEKISDAITEFPLTLNRESSPDKSSSISFTKTLEA